MNSLIAFSILMAFSLCMILFWILYFIKDLRDIDNETKFASNLFLGSKYDNEIER